MLLTTKQFEASLQKRLQILRMKWDKLMATVYLSSKEVSAK